MSDQTTYYDRDYAREEEIRVQAEQAATTAVLFALALGLGALVTVLFVQNSGEETRHDISRAFDDTADSGRDAVKRLEKEYAHLRKKVEEALQHQ
jgi:hypothetical protein